MKFNLKLINKFFHEYNGRYPTTKEIEHIKKTNEPRPLRPPTIQSESGKINKRTVKKYLAPVNHRFRSEIRALRVVEYHLNRTKGLKLPPSDEMREILSKRLHDEDKNLLSQI
jgi:hypothetical protein